MDVMRVIKSMGYEAAVCHPEFEQEKDLVYEMIEGNNLDVARSFSEGNV